MSIVKERLALFYQSTIFRDGETWCIGIHALSTVLTENYYMFYRTPSNYKIITYCLLAGGFATSKMLYIFVFELRQ
jgi:hypothetical protein